MSNYTLDTTKLDEIIRSLPSKIDAFLSTTSDEIVSEVKESFGESPSAPGEPPGVITGALRDSVEAMKTGDGSYQVIVGENYGRFLEFGTETIAPRPFMTPIFHTWEHKFASEVADAGIIE